MSRGITFVLIAGFLAAGCCEVFAQRASPPRNETKPEDVSSTRITSSDGSIADGANVFIGRGESMTLIGSGKNIRVLDSAGQRGNVTRLTQTGGGIDLGAVLDRPPAVHDSPGGSKKNDGDMGEYLEDYVTQEELAHRRVAFYYVAHPDHGFAFVPTQPAPPPAIRLRPPGTLKVHVPRQYQPEGYVVLACWMNRYADPISSQPLQTGAGIGSGITPVEAYGGMGDMGMFGGYGGGVGPGNMNAVSEPLRGHFSHWRLRTMVTHWVVAEIEDGEEGSPTNQATVVLPPGEVRVTLVPKAIVEKHKQDAVALERLLFFGGPSKIVLTESDAPGVHVRLAILPSRAVRDIELVGRASATGMPNWSEEKSEVFLTAYRAEPPRGVSFESDRAAMAVAESSRRNRSESVLGRIAHRIGKDRYLVVGVPVDRYYVWSVDVNDRPALARCIKSCGFIEHSGALQPMSVRMVSPDQFPSPRAAPAAMLPGTDKNRRRRLYRIFPATAAPQRFLIDLTRRAELKPVDPDVDPFTAKTLPNEGVGVIGLMDLRSETAGETSMAMGMDEVTDSEMMSMDPADTAAPTQQESPSQPPPNVEDLRRRIERLEKDLQRAKKLLRQITGEPIDSRRQ